MSFAINGGTVYFIGAGPGAVDLITLRGHAHIGAADLILLADSLIDPAIAGHARPDARIVGSSTMSLDELIPLMVEASARGEVVVRLQSGDPTVYGAIHEQMAALRTANVPFEIIPGVSSAFAAAAALGVELTVPSVAQTVILSRAPGRASRVPESESLRSLAAHGATLVLFLSAGIIDRAVADLIEGGYAAKTPAAIAYRVSWEDEQLIRCALADVPAAMRDAGITRTALVLVGAALGSSEAVAAARSRLYDAAYGHRYRAERE